MVDTICEENSICDTLINENIHVVVLDDNMDIRDAINEVITKKLGWKVIIIERREDAVKLCQDNKAVFYILDINLGAERSQEGIDTAEEIKQINKDVFVCIFSGVPNLKSYKRRADKVRVDYFENKDDGIAEGVSRIAVKMLSFQKNLLDNIFQTYVHSSVCLGEDKILKVVNKTKEVNKKLNDIKELEESYQSNSTEYFGSDRFIDEDKNVREYKFRKKDPEWREKYQNKYVAFADGKWLEDIVTDNLKDLLNELKLKTKEKCIFYKKVSKNNIKGTQENDNLAEEEEVYELPMSFYDFYPTED
jgi:CheY-like chemotaxis protein